VREDVAESHEAVARAGRACCEAIVAGNGLDLTSGKQDLRCDLNLQFQRRKRTIEGLHLHN
jgi:phage protein D